MPIIKDLLKVRSQHRIFFDEPEDPRILKACKILKKKKICVPVFVSNKGYPGFETIMPELKGDLIAAISKQAKIKTPRAKKLLKQTNWYATALLMKGKGKAYISGALHPTARTLHPALKLLNVGFASSYFLMSKGKKEMLFADCAFNIDPKPEELAKIAIDTQNSAKNLGMIPKVAMLSFSTNRSAKHLFVDKIRKATIIAKRHLNNVDGEMQFDAAINAIVANKKFPESKIAGKANVLIFPDLNSGNIAYKVASRLGNYKAIGPITQGFSIPVNDLSRGCTVEEIVLTTAMTVKQI